MNHKEATDLSIEMWEFLADTGGDKEDHPDYEVSYKYLRGCCPLCELYDETKTITEPSCNSKCPLEDNGHTCYDKDSLFEEWDIAESNETRAEVAKDILKAIKGE